MGLHAATTAASPLRLFRLARRHGRKKPPRLNGLVGREMAERNLLGDDGSGVGEMGLDGLDNVADAADTADSVGDGGRAVAASIAFTASAVVRPRLPALTPVEPNW